MSGSLPPDRATRPQRIAVLRAVGLGAAQIARLLQRNVTIEQLRGMLKLRQCTGRPAAEVAGIAAQIDRLEELEKLPLDSHIR